MPSPPVAPDPGPAGLREVAPGVLAWLQPPGTLGQSNAALVVGDAEDLLVDTLWDVPRTRAMLRAFGRRSANAIAALVNTHGDGDHVFGNGVVRTREVIATPAAIAQAAEESPQALHRLAQAAPVLRRIGRLPLPAVGRLPLPLVPRLPLAAIGAYLEEGFGPFAFDDAAPRVPTRAVRGETTIVVGGRRVTLIEAGPAHTAGDLFVHVPDARTVVAGDIGFVGVTPIMWAGPTATWLAAIDRIVALEPDVVVPGHGPACGPQDLAPLREHLAWLQEQAPPRLEAGASASAVARELLASREHRDGPWATWRQPERVLTTIATIDRHRRGVGERPVTDRERLALIARMGVLAEELRRAGRRPVEAADA